MTGQNGGGAFVLVYLVCIAAIGIPIMVAEVMIGRRGRQSPINSMVAVAAAEGRSRSWRYLGWCVTLAAFIILSFYSVIAGWSAAYVLKAGTGAFTGASAAEIGLMFDGLLASPATLLLWHTVFILLTALVTVQGVRGGLERATSFMMPALLVLLLILVGYAMTTGGFGQAVGFLFTPDFSKISTEGILSALGHAFFTLSLASGAMMAYGSYLPKNVSIMGASVTVAIMDTCVALLAGLAIFPLVFANGLEPGAGPGLVFKTLPLAFGQMPGGTFFGCLFFILLIFAAWTSTISMLESSVEWLEEKGLPRSRAAVIAAFGAWALGVVTVLSFNHWSDVAPLAGVPGFADKTWFDLFDYLTANIMMPLGGLAIAVFAGWAMSGRTTAEDLGAGIGHRVWRFLIRFVAPVGVAVIFIANLA
jgi:NSS family neurotransmitter:Na+ symporter